RAVSGNDAGLERYPQSFQRFGGMAHRGPVRLAAHDQADQRAALGGGFGHVASSSGDDIGNELAFQLVDLVLQPELALLEALKLELVKRWLLQQPFNDLVEVAMFALQRFQLVLDRLGVQWIRSRVAHARRPHPGGLATRPPAVYP